MMNVSARNGQRSMMYLVSTCGGQKKVLYFVDIPERLIHAFVSEHFDNASPLEYQNCGGTCDRTDVPQDEDNIPGCLWCAHAEKLGPPGCGAFGESKQDRENFQALGGLIFDLDTIEEWEVTCQDAQAAANEDHARDRKCLPEASFLVQRFGKKKKAPR